VGVDMRNHVRNCV